MKSLAVFYHCKISGEGISDPHHAENVLVEQMEALKYSGLAQAASMIQIGVNGTDVDALMVSSVVPPTSGITMHGPHVKSEIPTQQLIEKWLPGHEDWYVLYHHTKGVTHPGHVAYDVWRRRMESACVWNWRECISALDSGFDAAGCHWLTPERFPGAVTSPFFGGTFWWATARYLMQLPKLPAPSWENRFEAESWIGRRRPYPVVMDYFPGWP